MVKLFIGNLADGVDSEQLRALFQRFVRVQECDVLKNFAFVGYILLPSFTCGMEEHKTSQCPKNPNSRKREISSGDELITKKPKPLIFSNEGNITPVIEHQSNCWGYKVVGESDSDPELPCPQNPELLTLYEQYLESRTRYFFYRERLTKEFRLQQQHYNYDNVPADNTNIPLADIAQQNAPSIIRVDLTQHIRSQGQQVAPTIARRTIIPEHDSKYHFTVGNDNKPHQLTALTNPANYLQITSSTTNHPTPFSNSLLAPNYSSTSSTFVNSTALQQSARSPLSGSMPHHYNTASIPMARHPIQTNPQPMPLSAIQISLPRYGNRR